MKNIQILRDIYKSIVDEVSINGKFPCRSCLVSCTCKSWGNCPLLEKRDKELVVFLDDNICPDCGEREMIEDNYKGNLLLAYKNVFCSKINCIKKYCCSCNHTFFVTVYFGVFRVVASLP